MKEIHLPAYLQELFDKYKYVLPVLLVGVCLLLWPTTKKEVQEPQAVNEPLWYDMNTLEKRVESVLENIDGVGRVQVVLSMEQGEEIFYAYDRTESRNESETGAGATSQRELVTLSENGGQVPIELRRTAPVYRGAAVVCDGGDSPSIRLAVTQVIQSLTGISADRIVISKMKQ